MWSNERSSASRAHLDHAAHSPLRPVAREALLAGLDAVGNPSGLHASARAARSTLEDARESLAADLGAHPTEVVLTSGGSEADTLAVLGAVRARPGRRHAVVSAVEHPAVAGVVGREPLTRVAPVDADGRVLLDELARLVDVDTSVVSVMTVNNETGTVEPVEDVVEIAHASGAWAHSDAVQALGRLPLDFGASGLDLMTVSAHKVGGPVGVGALVVRRALGLVPVGLGGGQESGLRSGTQLVALASAFAAASRAAVDARTAEDNRLRTLTRCIESCVALIPGSRVNGGQVRSASIVNVTFDGIRADDVLLLLDRAGVDCSTGSACRAGVHQPSDVLLAMGRTSAEASASLRFSLGWSTTAGEIDRLVLVLGDAVAGARRASG